jgi:hypothetical protein
LYNNIDINERNKNKPNENSNGSFYEVNDINKKEIIRKNNANNNKNNQINNNINNNTNQNNKAQLKNLTILINSNKNSKRNIKTNIKVIKENELINIHSQKFLGNNISKCINYNNQAKPKKNQIITNININAHRINNKENNNNHNDIIGSNEKYNHIIIKKNNKNSRYKNPNSDLINNLYNNIRNLCNSITESDKKTKILSVSHNKSKSGSGSLIKYKIQNTNILNMKSVRNLMRRKSISPTIKRKNWNSSSIKEKGKKIIKSKSQSRSKPKNYKINKSKQKSLKEKMDNILSKNIIALTKKVRKSQSPKIRNSRPSLTFLNFFRHFLFL